MSQIISTAVMDDLQALRGRFGSAQPFRHVVIDDFFAKDVAEGLVADFPPFEAGNFVGDDGRPGGKSTNDRVREIGPAYRLLDDAIQEPEFLSAIGNITGIDDLRYDPFYLGGGTHENRGGQGLQPHIDFNYHPSERWHRRLNLIVYLNREWRDEWGGALDLYRDPYEDAEPVVRIAPAFNRCVIFETTEHSWHGFDPITLPDEAAGVSRKSVALYFYSHERPDEEVASRHTTHYVNRQLPQRFEPGYALSGDDVALLRALIAARDGQLKQLYAENAKLLAAQDAGFVGHVLYLLKRLYVRFRR